MNKRKHIDELIYMRAIAAFGIFSIHASGVFAVYSEFASKAQYLGAFLNQFFRFGTPIFIAISGFVLFYNYSSPEEFDFKAFIKKKLTYIILPYIIWSIGYFLFTAYMYSLDINLASIKQLLIKLPIGNTYAHLYFIFLIVQFYLLFPIILRLLGKLMKEKPLVILSICLALQASLLIRQYYFMAPSTNWAIKLLNTYYWKTVFGWFFYFISGGLAAFHYHKLVDIINKYIKLIISGYIVSTILFLGEAYLSIYVIYGIGYYEKLGSIRPMNLIYAVFTFFILVWLTRKLYNTDTKITKAFKSFGTYSLGIYFAHPMVLEFLKIRLFARFPGIFGYNRMLSIIIIIALGWIMTVGLCYMISLFKFRWLFLGKVPSIYTFKKQGLRLNTTNQVNNKVQSNT